MKKLQLLTIPAIVALVSVLCAPTAIGATGLGAWHTSFYYGMAIPDGRTAAGVHAVKQELIYDGYSQGIVLSKNVFGRAARDRTIEFQKAHRVAATGVVNATTGRGLFRRRTRAAETLYAIPNDLLCRQKTLESANDPVAQGYSDPSDEGLFQIHLPFYLDVTQAQAWDPPFAIPWAAAHLASAFSQLHDWAGAVAAYNVGGYYAGRWVAAGKPVSGLVVGGTDWYERAYGYVQLVTAERC